MTKSKSWTWETVPTNPAEFDAMMRSVDAHLAKEGRAPNQRWLEATRLVAMALSLGGRDIFTRQRGRPFGPEDLLPRVGDWYDAFYGDKNKIDFSPGSYVVSLREERWRIGIPRIFGTLDVFLDRDLSNVGVGLGANSPATTNLLNLIDQITQPFANSLSDSELAILCDSMANAFHPIQWLDDLTGHALFDEARSEYRQSIDAVMEKRVSNARWSTAQCAEKVLKGVLARRGHGFPKDAKQGHDIKYLCGLVSSHLGIQFDPADADLVYCRPAVRYGETQSTITEALASHHALLRLMASLAKQIPSETHRPTRRAIRVLRRPHNRVRISC